MRHHRGHSEGQPKNTLLQRAAAGCAVVLVAVGTVSTSIPANADAVNILPPGRINSLVPSEDEVGVFTGLPMHAIAAPGQIPSPPVHLAQRDECRVLAEFFTIEVWGSDFTAFRSQAWNYQPDPTRSYVSEAVATFQDAAAAQKAESIFSPNLFNTCIHAEFPAPDSDPSITSEIFDFKLNGPVAAWNVAYKANGQSMGYNCFRIALDLKNVMAISGACQFGNPSQTVTRLSDLILDRIG